MVIIVHDVILNIESKFVNNKLTAILYCITVLTFWITYLFASYVYRQMLEHSKKLSCNKVTAVFTQYFCQ